MVVYLFLFLNPYGCNCLLQQSFFPRAPSQKKKRLDEGNKEKKKKGVGGVTYAL